MAPPQGNRQRNTRKPRAGANVDQVPRPAEIEENKAPSDLGFDLGGVEPDEAGGVCHFL